VVAIVLLWLTQVFSYLPKAILAAIIFVAVLAIIDTDQASYLWKVNKSEFGLMLLTFIITLGIGPQYGIFISIGLSLLLVLFKSSRPGFAILGRLPGTAVYKSILDFPDAICIPGIVLFQFHSPIYFMNATYLKKKLIYTETLLSRNGTRTEAIIIDAQAITSVDSAGLTIIKDIVEYYNARNTVICFASFTVRSEQALRRAGLQTIIGESNFYPRLHDAIRAALNQELRTATPAPAVDLMPVEEHVDIPEDSAHTSFFGKITSAVKYPKRKTEEKIDHSSDVEDTMAIGGVGGLGSTGPGDSTSSDKSSSADSSESPDHVALDT